MSFVQTFKELHGAGSAVAGGKGAALADLERGKFPVPGGFVVIADAFRRFLEETDIDVEVDAELDRVDVKNMQTVEVASERLHFLIVDADMPRNLGNDILRAFKELHAPFVAVRSSATVEDSKAAAWAGQLESYLNTTEETLLQNVKRCWASLFSPRAIFYRLEQGMRKAPIAVAVVVQKMLQSKVSGVAFSVHPVTEDYNQVLIEAGLGLGEAIVSGSITPDQYVVRKETWETIDRNVSIQERGLFRKRDGGNEWQSLPPKKGGAQKLADADIRKLSQLVTKIETYFGLPVDVEWAKEGRKLYVLQSRPITTLSTGNAPLRALDRFLSRDAPLIAIEHWWYKGCTEAFPAFLGFPHPTLVMLYARGTCTSYRDTEAVFSEYIGKYREWFQANPDRLHLIHRRLVDGLKKFREAMQLKRGTPERELMRHLEIVIHHFLRGFPSVNAVHQLPVLHEQLQAKGESPFDEARIQTLISWREQEGNHFFNEGIEAFYFLLSRIGETKKWNADLLKYVTYEELKEAIAKRTALPLKELQQRQDSPFVYFDGNVIFEPDIDAALQRKGYHLNRENVAGMREVKGVAATKGKVKGTARLIFERSQLSRVGKGDVLVAPMTSPWYLPAMEKAAAFVTDEGGVTCHAAIIAREMGKPCVTGTKIATDVIRDGDIVEVDASKSTVRILSRVQDRVPSISTSVADVIHEPHCEWEFYLTRPFTLLGASIWHEWLAGSLAEEILGATITDSLFFEVHPDVVRYYRDKRQLQNVRSALAHLISDEPDRMRDIFKRGIVLNAQAERALAKGVSAFRAMDSAIDFMIDLSVHATVVPFLGYGMFPKLKVKDEELWELGKQLRSVSYYPQVFNELVVPLAEKHLSKEYGIREKEAASVLTLRELRGGRVQDVQQRLQWRREGKRFVFRTHAATDRTVWTDAIETHLPEIEAAPDAADAQMLRGQCAFPGKVRGVARIVLTDKPQEVHFEEGNILVSINSTPALMPLIRKCAGIVTDEGGVSCHAAVVSRELKKPCVMGTGLATAVIRDGDVVELDAMNGTVKVLNKN